MSDIEFDHDAVAGYPRPLHTLATSLAAASTLPTPDAGTSTALAREAIDRVAVQSAALGGAYDDLCEAVLFCLERYPQADQGSGWLLEMQAEQALR
ncbi:hypothetical protein NODU109028_11340 [Nocardioides dubius]|uniref:Uncharacterized protein n=1 Tax=Nocardioides dubius TaxID=317019 RepID=A0ABN1TRR2_9ACTN